MQTGFRTQKGKETTGPHLVSVKQVGESEGKRTHAGILAVAVPNIEVCFSPSCRITSAKRRRPGDDTGYHKMVGEDHEVEPALATTGTVPWLLTYLLLAGCSKMGQSGCPVHNRRSQKRAFNALQALVNLAAQGNATDTISLLTSWGEARLSVDGSFIVTFSSPI